MNQTTTVLLASVKLEPESGYSSRSSSVSKKTSGDKQGQIDSNNKMEIHEGLKESENNNENSSDNKLDDIESKLSAMHSDEVKENNSDKTEADSDSQPKLPEPVDEVSEEWPLEIQFEIKSSPEPEECVKLVTPVVPIIETPVEPVKKKRGRRKTICIDKTLSPPKSGEKKMSRKQSEFFQKLVHGARSEIVTDSEIKVLDDSVIINGVSFAARRSRRMSIGVERFTFDKFEKKKRQSKKDKDDNIKNDLALISKSLEVVSDVKLIETDDLATSSGDVVACKSEPLSESQVESQTPVSEPQVESQAPQVDEPVIPDDASDDIIFEPILVTAASKPISILDRKKSIDSRPKDVPQVTKPARKKSIYIEKDKKKKSLDAISPKPKKSVCFDTSQDGNISVQEIPHESPKLKLKPGRKKSIFIEKPNNESSGDSPAAKPEKLKPGRKKSIFIDHGDFQVVPAISKPGRKKSIYIETANVSENDESSTTEVSQKVVKPFKLNFDKVKSSYFDDSSSDQHVDKPAKLKPGRKKSIFIDDSSSDQQADKPVKLKPGRKKSIFIDDSSSDQQTEKPAKLKPGRKKSIFIDDSSNDQQADKPPKLKPGRKKSIFIENGVFEHGATPPLIVSAVSKPGRKKSIYIEAGTSEISSTESTQKIFKAEKAKPGRKKSIFIEKSEQIDEDKLPIKKRGRKKSIFVAQADTEASTSKKRPRDELDSSMLEMTQPTKRRKTSESDFEPVVVEEVIEDIWHVHLITIEREHEPRFLVKWDGFPLSENTYEPYEHVQHAEVLKDYVKRKYEMHQDRINDAMERLLADSREHYELYVNKPKSFILSKLMHFDAFRFQCNMLAFIYTYDRIVNYSEFMRRLRYHSILFRFYKKVQREKSINDEFFKKIMKKEKKAFIIKSENRIDFDVVPTFNYLRKVEYPKMDKPKVGCKCETNCMKSSACCPQTMNVEFVFDVDKRICATSHQMIVECNDACSCDSSCVNRPKTPKFGFSVFKTSNRGWALKTLDNIPAGSFVIEYIGELIDQAEAKKRSRVYNKTGVTYLFDLDYNIEAEADFSIDATHKGNLSRFINHSCEANLQTWPATSCNDNPNMHRLYYFALRSIRSGEELTIDYSGGVHLNPRGTPPKDAITCKCGTVACKGYIF